MSADEELLALLLPGWELARIALTMAYHERPQSLLSEMTRATHRDAAMAAFVLALELAELMRETGVDDAGLARYQAAAAHPGGK